MPSETQAATKINGYKSESNAVQGNLVNDACVTDRPRIPIITAIISKERLSVTKAINIGARTPTRPKLTSERFSKRTSAAVTQRPSNGRSPSHSGGWYGFLIGATRAYNGGCGRHRPHRGIKVKSHIHCMQTQELCKNIKGDPAKPGLAATTC